MHAKFGREPMAGSEKVTFKFINISRYPHVLVLSNCAQRFEHFYVIALYKLNIIIIIIKTSYYHRYNNKLVN